MVLGEIQNQKESQLEMAAIDAFRRGDYDAAIGYILAEIAMLRPPLEVPPMPPVYGKSASIQITTKKQYYLKILRLLKSATADNYVKIRKEMKSPLTISIIGKKKGALA